MRLALEIVGVPETCAGIKQGVMRLQAATLQAMGAEMIGLRNYAVTTHMHGPTGANTVNQRSGNLARSVTSQATDEGADILGLVGIPEASTAQAYARILHEGGTTRAHVIEAQEAKSLAFMVNGQMIFRRKVNHPGSVFPARPYLTSALQEQAGQIKANLKAAMLEAIA